MTHEILSPLSSFEALQAAKALRPSNTRRMPPKSQACHHLDFLCQHQIWIGRVAREAELSKIPDTWRRLLSWLDLRMKRGKKKTKTTPIAKVRPTYWHVRQNHLSYRSSNCQPPNPHHMGGGKKKKKKPLWEELFGLSSGAGSLFLIPVEVARECHSSTATCIASTSLMAFFRKHKTTLAG